MRNTDAGNTMGTRIREMRKAAGMSQEQLAEILCTKKATISAYENDHIDIKSSIVLEIAKALNCSGSYLLEGKKAFLTTRTVINQIETYINDAISIEDKGVYYYFWAYIKYDYYKRKSFRRIK